VERRYLSFLGRADKGKGIDLFFRQVETLSPGRGHTDFRLSRLLIFSLTFMVSPLGSQPTPGGQQTPFGRQRAQRWGDQQPGSPASLKGDHAERDHPISPDERHHRYRHRHRGYHGVDPGLGNWGDRPPRNPSIADIEAAISFIEEKLPALSLRCRDYYLATFDDRNRDRDYGRLQTSLSPFGKTT
jgi:hypothetical protein